MKCIIRQTPVKMICYKWKYLFCLALDRLAHLNLDCLVVTMSCIKYALISILWSFTGQSDFPQLFLVMNQEVLCNGAHYAKCLNKSYFPNNPEDTDHCRALYWHCQFDSSSHKRKTFAHLVKPLGVPTTRQSCFAEVAIVTFLLSFYWSCFLYQTTSFLDFECSHFSSFSSYFRSNYEKEVLSHTESTFHRELSSALDYQLLPRKVLD